MENLARVAGWSPISKRAPQRRAALLNEGSDGGSSHDGVNSQFSLDSVIEAVDRRMRIELSSAYEFSNQKVEIVFCGFYDRKTLWRTHHSCLVR